MVLGDEGGSHVAAELDGMAPAPTRHLSVTNPPNAYRHSMDEYYQREANGSSIIPSDAPPDYDTLLDSPSLRRRFNIQPREDEGREVLPAYSSAISLRAVFQRKMELEGAIHKAANRDWNRVYVTLQGTALTFHKCKIPGVFPTKSRSTPDFPAGTQKGTLLQSYNLTHADVGIAADYLKKRYVIRVRAEADQFLLSCHKIETFVLWLQSLFAAIDLAPPLDDREIPRDLSVPRRSRRRIRVEAVPETASNVALAREQQDLQTQFPTLAETPSGDVSDALSMTPTDTSPEDNDDLDLDLDPALSDIGSLPPSRPATSSGLPHRPTIPIEPLPARGAGLIARARQALQSSTHLSQYASPALPNPSITSDGKWRPTHHWTHFYDMMYAKRCMAILTHRSPRKSNLVIMKGKLWGVDWGTGRMESVGPPDYGDVGQHGSLGGGKGLGLSVTRTRSREVGSVVRA